MAEEKKKSSPPYGLIIFLILMAIAFLVFQSGILWKQSASPTPMTGSA
tara:strand:- start:420 stop:563 length:144 start_codon:yes stop_codon:yes gene_type:complete